MPAAEPDTTPWVEEENTYESSPDSPDEVIVGEEAEKKMKEESMKMMWKALFAPALIGTYAIVGLYIGRAASGSTSRLPLGTVALVAGSSAASAYAAPMLSKFVVCPSSASRPLVEAGISSAVSWTILAGATGAESATRFVPVQLLSYGAGIYMAPKVKRWLKGPSEEEAV
jgi:hypothetical protein